MRKRVDISKPKEQTRHIVVTATIPPFVTSAGLQSAPIETAPRSVRRRMLKARAATTDAFCKRERDDAGKLIPIKKARKQRSTSASVFNRAMAETEAMMASRDWSHCAARHLVALYEIMHRKTYGVSAEMSGSERYRSTGRMAAFTRRAFNDDMIAAVEFYRWLWIREREREQWCRDNGRERNTRLGFGLSISGEMVADYKVQRTRQARQTTRDASS